MINSQRSNVTKHANITNGSHSMDKTVVHTKSACDSSKSFMWKTCNISSTKYTRFERHIYCARGDLGPTNIYLDVAFRWTTLNQMSFIYPLPQVFALLSGTEHRSWVNIVIQSKSTDEIHQEINSPEKLCPESVSGNIVRYGVPSQLACTNHVFELGMKTSEYKNKEFSIHVKTKMLNQPNSMKFENEALNFPFSHHIQQLIVRTSFNNWQSSYLFNVQGMVWNLIVFGPLVRVDALFQQWNTEGDTCIKTHQTAEPTTCKFPITDIFETMESLSYCLNFSDPPSQGNQKRFQFFFFRGKISYNCKAPVVSLSESLMSWTAANELCNSATSELPVFRSTNEIAHLIALLKSSNYMPPIDFLFVGLIYSTTKVSFASSGTDV